MKKIFIISILLLTGLSWAQIEGTSEKEADKMEYELFNRAGTVSDTIDGSQTFDRTYSVSLDLNCTATSSDSSNNGVGYVVFDLIAPGGEALDAAVNGAGSTISDSVMFIYCAFDPFNPADDLVFWDDDGGVGGLSAITPADGVTLAAGTYKMVISGYGSSDDGDVQVDVGGGYDIQLAGGAGGAEVPTMSEWGVIFFASLLALGGIWFIRRK